VCVAQQGRNGEGALFCDDGFAMGVAFVLKLLDQVGDVVCAMALVLVTVVCGDCALGLSVAITGSTIRVFALV
jgi:hypothetical protein